MFGVRTNAFAAALAMFCGVGSSAHASDPWKGFYLGLNVGYAWGDADARVSGEETAGAANFILSQAFTSGTSNTPATYSQSVDAKGAFGGLQFGYRSRLSQLLVAGLEIDFQGASISGDGSTTGTAVVGTATMSTEQELKWFGTVRGQLGFLFSPQLMVFGSGGLAYGRTEITGILSTTAISSVSSGSTIFGGCAGGGAPCLKDSDSQVSVGWTAGGGVEWALQGNATFRIEYLHVDLGEQTARLTAPTGNAFIQTKIDNSYDLVREQSASSCPKCSESSRCPAPSDERSRQRRGRCPDYSARQPVLRRLGGSQLSMASMLCRGWCCQSTVFW